MSRSKRLRQLQERCRVLRRHFLPRKFSLTGSYSSRILDAARAYRLLIHAEMESYLEDRALEVSKTTLNKWTTQSKFSKPLVSLFAHAGENTILSGTISQRVHHIVKKYEEIIRSNNGLKKKDLMKILNPIGIEEHDLDPLWITVMDNFGKQRGLVAHQSLATQLTSSTINPQDEFNTINSDILPGIKDLDEALGELMIP